MYSDETQLQNNENLAGRNSAGTVDAEHGEISFMDLSPIG